jgi:UDP-N-acetylmuramoylalanine--D-glutamate ligase
MSLTTPVFLRPLLARPVAILGAGACGRGLTALLDKLGVVETQVYDQAHGTAFDFNVDAAARCGLVIFSSDFRSDHPWLMTARATGCECMGELDFAALFWRGQVIAVAGSEGRETLVEFLTFALRSNGFEASAVCDRGYSFAQLVADCGGGSLAAAEKIAVCEVNSSQAGTLRHFRADATLWTNYSETDFDGYSNPAACFAANWTLVACTAPGGFVAGSSVQVFASRWHLPLPARAAVATVAQPADPRLAETVFATYPMRESFVLAAAWWGAAGFQPGELYAAARTFRVARKCPSSEVETAETARGLNSKIADFLSADASPANSSALHATTLLNRSY